MSMSRKLPHKTSYVEKEQDKLTACWSSASDGRNRLEEGGEEFVSLTNQLQALGLKLREVPGDGNCLFRALGDQLEGHSRGHLRLRQETVQYMQGHRQDFEPFVEDEIPFTEYLSNLSQQGTFAGNDAIVAFARSHQLRVIIHQLNTPMWEINGADKSAAQELHIAYRYGDHYDSVRLIGDNSESPARLRIENLDRSRGQCAVWQLRPRQRHKQSASPPTYSRDEDMILRRLPPHSPSGLAESRRQHRVGPEALTVPHAALWEDSGTGARIFGPVAAADDSDSKLWACRSKLADKAASKERKESQWPEKKNRQEERQNLKDQLSRAPQDQNQSDKVTMIPAFKKLSI